MPVIRCMFEMTLAVLWLCAVACAPVDAHVITATPTTINVTLDDQTRQALQRTLADGSLAIARLSLRDMTPRAAQALKGVKIFIEKPDADSNSPVEDPHYAGAF